MNDVISLCTPCMNRTYDLKAVMPSRLLAAAKSPPVELCIVNYGSQDDLDDYVAGLELPAGVTLTYCRVQRRFWHMANAYNVAIRSSHGAYFWLMGTDVALREDAIMQIRALLTEGYVWMYPKRYRGVIICQRAEFMAAGGYDERFEFYGPEDKELDLRLRRRGGKLTQYPYQLLQVIRTPEEQKIKHYRVRRERQALSELMMPYYQDNAENYRLVVNVGQEWGAWN